MKTKDPAQAAKERQERLSKGFTDRVDALRDWGLEEGIVIDAYLRYSPEGVTPIISFKEMTPAQAAEYKTWSTTRTKTSIDIDKHQKN
jgi:hypothetical protein